MALTLSTQTPESGIVPARDFDPPDACAPNTIWHLLPTGTGSKNVNKSSGYSPTKQELAQGKAAFLLHSDTRSAQDQRRISAGSAQEGK
jgi:hypothetical protein